MILSMKDRYKQFCKDVEEFVTGTLHVLFNLGFLLLVLWGVIKFAQMIL